MDYAQQQRNPLKHLVGFSLVLILHVVVIYALINGLARKIVDVIKPPFETKIVEEHKPPPPPEAPPPPPPKINIPPPPFIPPPEVQIAIAQTAPTISQVTTKTPPPQPVVIAPRPRVAPTPARLDRDRCPTADPTYPMASRRNQETGTLILRVLVDARGSPSQVEIKRSSGHARLDEAAKSWIMTCPFRPGTSEGKPIATWAEQQYTFRLTD